MTFIKSLLFGDWAKLFWPALGIFLAFLYWNDRTEKIRTLEADLAAAKSAFILEQQIHEDDVTRLTQEIENQNQSINVIHTAHQVQLNQLNTQIAVLTTSHQKSDQQLQQALGQLANAPKLNSCEAAISFIVDVAIQNPWPVEKK